jgi:hypothetical protein
MPIGTRSTMLERERRANNLIFRLLVHFSWVIKRWTRWILRSSTGAQRKNFLIPLYLFGNRACVERMNNEHHFPRFRHDNECVHLSGTPRSRGARATSSIWHYSDDYTPRTWSKSLDISNHRLYSEMTEVFMWKYRFRTELRAQRSVDTRRLIVLWNDWSLYVKILAGEGIENTTVGRYLAID